MLQSYKVYTLEDGKDFVLIDTLEYNNKKYLLLSSESNSGFDDLKIRRKNFAKTTVFYEKKTNLFENNKKLPYM